MRSSYKTGGKSQKQEIIQKSFNQMDLNVIIVVIMLTNNNTVQVMNKKFIKQSIRMYLRKVFDKENSAMRQFKEKLSISKIKKLMINVHNSWCSHLIKDKDKFMILLKHMIY